MSVDDRIRHGLVFERAERRLEVERLLREVELKAARRRRTRIGAGLAVAACIVGLLAVLLTPGDDARDSVPPVQPSTDTTRQPVVTSAACNTALFECVDGTAVAMTMGTRVEWDPSANASTVTDFTADRARDEVLLVEIHRSDTDSDEYAGVDIVQDVRAPSLTHTGRADRTVADDPRAIAQWLAQRPDLRASAAREGTFDGRPAWTVTVRPTIADEDATAECNDRFACTPILHVDGAGRLATQGVFEGLVSRFTFVEVPGSGVVAVWSWALPDDQRLLQGNRALVSSITFGGPSAP